MHPLPAAETHLFQFTVPLPPWAVILLLGALGWAIHRGFRSGLKRLASTTDTAIDDVVVDVGGRVLPLWILLSILFVGLEMVGGDAPRLLAGGNLLIGAVFLCSLFWAVYRFVLQTMEKWSEKNPQFTPVHPPARFVFKAVVAIVGVVTLLSYFDVDVSALLATLGVGGLAVALALKDTLENFFAGLHIMADRPIRQGDWVHIHETGDRGEVLKIGWRSTRILTLDHNTLVLPNVKLSSGAVTNLTVGDPSTVVRIQVGVGYDCDPDRVAALLEEEARNAVGAVPGLAAVPAPVALLIPGFGPSSLDFTLRVHAASLPDVPAVQDGLRRRVLRRLRAEGIAIPYPITTVLLPGREGDGKG
jgi:small-conductance mechanosensitive channel